MEFTKITQASLCDPAYEQSATHLLAPERLPDSMGDVRLVLGTPPDDHLHSVVHHHGVEYLRVHTQDHRLGGIREQPGKVTGNGFTTYGINDNATSLFSTLSLSPFTPGM